MKMNLEKINEDLKDKTPQEIVQWAVSQAKRPIVTSNFGPYSASILHLVTAIKPDIKVVWVDTGYNTSYTYKYAHNLIQQLALNIKIYVPKLSMGYRNIQLGIPSVDDPNHQVFTEQVKLEPFRRAMNEHQPDVWFTNLRKGQTAFRDSIDIVSQAKDGTLKVSPFYNWSDEELGSYLIQNDLPNETKYLDPTKQFSNRECGLHV